MNSLPVENTFAFEEMVADVAEYAVFTLGLDGRVQNWNRGAELIKQYTPEEIVGQHFSVFYLEEDRQAKMPETELEIVTEKGSFVDEGWRVKKDGTRFWASVTLTAIRSAEDSQVAGFLKITRDLTDRMLSVEALRQSEERFRLLLESVDDYAIFMLDPEGHVMSWNTGARRLKGYDELEIVGSHFSIFYPEEARLNHTPENLLRSALAKGRIEVQGWRVKKDGSRFWGNVAITALYDHGGELRGFAKVTRDLTHQREVERLQESGRRKDVFLATLGHELRNPLAPLLPGVEILRRSAGDPAAVERLASMFERQVGQMARLIDDLLDMSRIASGKIELRRQHIALSEVIEGAAEAVKPLIEQRGHAFQIFLPERELIVNADPHRLSQIVTNLLTNAARYTDDGGKIALHASVQAGAMLEIKVTDTGRGIAPDMQEKIFELFEQVSAEAAGGLGIGLTLVRNLAGLHGGDVSVHSGGEGQGSEFTVSLPILTAAVKGAAASADSSGQTVHAPTAPRVLVADDGRSAADIMGMFFEMEGLEVAIAYDGEEAVEKALAFLPDLVFLDLGMPKLDGFGAARRIAQFLPGVPIIALSGWGREDDKRRSAEAGFSRHLIKPVKPDDLRGMIAEYLPEVVKGTS